MPGNVFGARRSGARLLKLRGSCRRVPVSVRGVGIRLFRRRSRLFGSGTLRNNGVDRIRRAVERLDSRRQIRFGRHDLLRRCSGALFDNGTGARDSILQRSIRLVALATLHDGGGFIDKGLQGSALAVKAVNRQAAPVDQDRSGLAIVAHGLRAKSQCNVTGSLGNLAQRNIRHERPTSFAAKVTTATSDPLVASAFPST